MPVARAGSVMNTEPQTVTITAACPDCGTDATWHGTCTEPGQSTSYQIECMRCDRPWSLAMQIARRLERAARNAIERTAA